MDGRRRRLTRDAHTIRTEAQRIVTRGVARRAARMEAEAQEMEARLIREHAQALRALDENSTG